MTLPEALAVVAEGRHRAAVLVEGWSDEAALEALAQACGLSLACERVIVLPMGGVTNLHRFASGLREAMPDLRLAGLYDASEEALVLHALVRSGLAAAATRAHAQALGFFACEDDLEDELIRALGPETVENLVRGAGEMASFRLFQAQPEHRSRPLHAQLRRFIGTRAGRKIRYGAMLVQALTPERAPGALQRVLEHLGLGPAPATQIPG